MSEVLGFEKSELWVQRERGEGKSAKEAWHDFF